MTGNVYLIEETINGNKTGYGQFYVNSTDKTLRYKSDTGSEITIPGGTYETGSFTPFFCDNSLTDEATYNDRRGRYIRIDNVIYCWGLMTLSGAQPFTSTQQVRLKGWPYSIYSGLDYVGFCRFPDHSAGSGGPSTSSEEFHMAPLDSGTMLMYDSATSVSISLWGNHWDLSSTGCHFYAKYRYT